MLLVRPLGVLIHAASSRVNTGPIWRGNTKTMAPYTEAVTGQRRSAFQLVVEAVVEDLMTQKVPTLLNKPQRSKG